MLVKKMTKNNHEGKILVQLIAAIINLQPLTVDEFDFVTLFRIAQFHSLENMIYYAIKRGLIKVSDDILFKINKIHDTQVFKAALQDSELEAIVIKLDKANIKHMPLKGSIIKNLYPSIDMRSMADLDILIEKGRLKEVTPIMKDLGYTVKSLSGNHDVYLKLPFMNIEMHRKMIDESYEMSKYYKSIWDKVELVEGKNNQYCLNDNDFYIYMIAHCAKHYKHAGTGIRSVLDIYVYLHHKNHLLAWDYINQELNKLKILLFANNIKQLAYIWFGNEKTSNVFEIMSDYIINSGTYGTSLNSYIIKGFMDSDLTNEKGLNKRKLRYLLSRAFPGYKIMKRMYPSLKYFFFLLPVYWILRLIKAIIIKRKNIKGQINQISSIKQADINQIKKVKKETGL
jgi:hypothetical protein